MQMCPHFRRCGGCWYLDVPYAEQFEKKKEYLKETLSFLDGAEIEELYPAPQKFFYRNKMEFTFGGTKEEPILGQHYTGSFSRIENLKMCLLFDERIGGILEDVRKFAKDFEIPPYDKKTHEGILRHLKVRVSKTTNEMMIILVTADGFDFCDEFTQVFKKHPFVKSIYHGINRKLSDIALCDEYRLIFGEKYIREKIDDVVFLVSPESFLQPNTQLAQIIYRRTKEEMGLTSGEYVLDLYCGSGGIGLYIAKDVKFIYAVDIDINSTKILEENLKVNGLKNLEVITGDVRKILPFIKRNNFDFAICDPPRSGMSKKAIRKLCSKNVKKIVFFSCKIETGVENIKEFQKHNFRVKKVMPYDMFPHTPHMEVIFFLER